MDTPRERPPLVTFEVTVGDIPCLVRMEIPAETWIEAWQLGLAELGEEAGPADVLCAIHPGERVVVKVRETGRRLAVRSLGRGGLRAADDLPPTLPAPGVAGVARRPALPTLDGSVAGTIPSVRPLSARFEHAAAEALAMLEGHVPCRLLLCLEADRPGDRLRVVAARGEGAAGLVGCWLATAEPLARMLGQQPALLKLHGAGSLLGFRGGLRGRRRDEPVRSLLGAPVGADAALALIDARRPTGFAPGELDALVYLAELLGQRRGSRRVG